jgi:predicted ribosomally synthesized peptide with SipW-like signal peptide
MLKAINTKMLVSGGVILAAAALIIGGTFAFFSDTETSSDNTFTAGAIDLTVSSTGKATNGVCNFTQTTGGPIFNCTDVKPGDSGESTVKFKLESNPAWACVVVDNIIDSDNGCNDPEIAAESTCATDGDGELDNNLLLTVWVDDSVVGVGGVCNNIQDSGEETLVTDKPLSSFSLPTGQKVLAVSDTSGASMLGANVPLQPGEHCLGIAWRVDSKVGNEVQTDKLSGDLSFYVEQSRNNGSFTCASHFAPVTGEQTLTLENETINPTGPWTPITGDQIFGTLTWQGDGPEFNYTFSAQGLQNATDYSLIYYADSWPGNNPGKFIGKFTTNGSGVISSTTQSVNLGMDLPSMPDANYGTGAKIWLVLSSDYNSGVFATGPMTAWNPGSYLFEGNVYIHYNDTDN